MVNKVQTYLEFFGLLVRIDQFWKQRAQGHRVVTSETVTKIFKKNMIFTLKKLV